MRSGIDEYYANNQNGTLLVIPNVRKLVPSLLLDMKSGHRYGAKRMTMRQRTMGLNNLMKFITLLVHGEGWLFLILC